MLIYRAVDAGYFTIADINRHDVSLTDIIRANQYIEIKNEAERRAIERSKQK
jgi:hypothetical protein